MFALGLVGVVCFVVWALWPHGRIRRPEDLRERYLRLLHMPRPAAVETYSRTLNDMRQRNPGRSEVWLLRKMLNDLERDRR